MQPQTIPRALAAAAVIVAAGLVLLARGRSDEPLPVSQPDEIRVAASDTSAPPAAAEAAPDPDALVAAKVRELEQMSETFRNTTFLIAIRDAGLVCNELLRVYGDIDASAKWMATCSEMHAYTVSVASTGNLHVQPTLQYFDGLWVQPILDETGPEGVPELRLDQRPAVPLGPQPRR